MLLLLVRLSDQQLISYKLEKFAGKSDSDDRFFYTESTGKVQLLIFKFTISSKKQIKVCLPRMNNFSDQVTSK